jgi:glycosyltransferase involved in cell wall biosynthesis
VSEFLGKPSRSAAPERARLAFVCTDATSFNHLMRGQLEYLSQHAEIDLYCGGSKDELRRLADRSIGRLFPIDFRRKPHPLWDAISLAALLRYFWRNHYATVVYSTPKAMLLGSIASFLSRQPRRIAWVRGRAYERMTGLKRKVFLWLDRLTFAASHKVLFVSHSLKEEYARDGLRSFKGEVVGHGSSNGVDLARFAPVGEAQRRELRRALGIGEDVFLMLMVGRITGDKGIDFALELMRMLRDMAQLRLLLVGAVEDPALAERIEGCGDSRVSMMGSRNDTEALYRAADLHLLLSHREGLPNVALEAAACALPTFGWDVVGVRDAVSTQSGRLFPFGDMEALAEGVRQAAEDPEGVANAFGGSRDWVGSRFDQTNVWQTYANIFLGNSEPPVATAADRYAADGPMTRVQ